MKDKFNDPFVVPASSLISIPVTETIAKLLQAMFSTKIGSLELEIDEDGVDGPQLIVSCYLSNVENNKRNGLTQMYTVVYSGVSGRRFRRHPDSKPETSGHLVV